MPRQETLLQQAEEWKTKGNEAFSKSNVDEAVSAYSQGIVLCDRLQPTPVDLKVTLLSNRAMCYLKVMKLRSCMEDSSSALQLFANPDVTVDTNLRVKILFRRAKASFLLANLSQPTDTELLQGAAKDLLMLLQADPSNKEANQLLHTVRAQHKSTQTANTPVSRAVQGLQSEDSLHNVKVLLGLLENDLKNTSMEMGRLGAVDALLRVATENTDKVAILAIQCLSSAGSHPAFARTFLVPIQAQLAELVASTENPDIVVSALAVYVRILLHADRDDPESDIVGDTLLDYPTIAQVISKALSRFQEKIVIRAVLDLIGTFTAGVDREAAIRMSLGNATDPTVPLPKTQAEIRSMTPQQLAAYRKREYEKKTRNQAWAFERSMMILTKTEVVRAYFDAAVKCTDHVVRREMTVTLGRLLANVEDEDKIKDVVKPLLSDEQDLDEALTIEEVYNEDGEEKNAKEEINVPLSKKMERAMITAALLLSKKDVGAWALGSGWSNSIDELPDLINSGEPSAMCLASEVVSAAATVESARHIVAGLTTSGAMQKLLMSDDRDIRSGAASAVAKLGLSDKNAEESEIMGLLQAACDLLEEMDDQSPSTSTKDDNKFRHFSSFANSSTERAVEMISYLIVNTVVKDEIAAGFSARPDSKYSALELLVKTADLPNVGESLSGFGLATIFQNMSATNFQIRKEGFEGKEVTMEQYDEMQKLGKTEEEKELLEEQRDPDTQASCNERIRKMASTNVPRAMVALTEGASEHTLEQIVLCLNRMAGEASVRGLMIQQGVLSACIKLEKNEGPADTDTMKKVVLNARHCIAKLLITTNPSLLTAAQRLGSIRPLVELVRDIKSSDLQKFEALLALTNLAGSGEDAQNRVVSEKGIPSLHFAMFSDHPMVRRAATEAMVNLVGNKQMMDFLANRENLKLWLAFATEYEEHYECARAAAGCLAMATQDEAIALELIELERFREEVSDLLESGRLEIMHRGLVIVLNLVTQGGKLREAAVKEGLVAFCRVYADSSTKGETGNLDFSEEEASLIPVTIDLAKKIVSMAEEES